MDKQFVNQTIKAARIGEVIGEFVRLKKRGESLVGVCPFCGDKGLKFSVSPKKRIFKCFACGEGGNVVDFLKKHKKYSHQEAIEWLAKKNEISQEEKPCGELNYLDNHEDRMTGKGPSYQASQIVFIDTEVGIESQKVKEYGAVRDDGAVLHTKSKKGFEEFVAKSKIICGHNIIHHDLKYLQLKGGYTYIDTLPLSPLLFPKKPYHKLLKDDKLQVEELNNPVNDAMKARDLYYTNKVAA